jgi:hypothetical protein
MVHWYTTGICTLRRKKDIIQRKEKEKTVMREEDKVKENESRTNSETNRRNKQIK